MRAWTAAAAATLWAASAFAGDGSPGRTDGPEGSEIGKGGYRLAGTPGTWSVAPFLGAAIVESDDDSETDLMYGLNVAREATAWRAPRGRGPSPPSWGPPSWSPTTTPRPT